MEFLSLFIISFSSIQLLIAFLNYIFVKYFEKSYLWKLSNAEKPLVSILIPARNEENNIPLLLDSLIKQKYTNIEILVYDDLSTDRTRDIVCEFQTKDTRIKILPQQSLPKDWKGKNFACHTLSKYAKGKYLLFLDADVTVHDDFISKLVAFAQKEHLSLISCFPEPITLTLGEKVTVPSVYYILLTLLPLPLVSKTKYPSISAANGQCMFFDADDYFRHQPHLVHRQSFVEDIEIARFFKKNQLRIMCLTGITNIKSRMYTNLQDAINGFSKNIVKILGNNYLTAFLFWIIVSFGFIPIILANHSKFLWLWLLQFFLVKTLVSLTIRQDILLSIILAPIQQFFIGIFIFKSLINKLTKKQVWKGRNLY